MLLMGFLDLLFHACCNLVLAILLSRKLLFSRRRYLNPETNRSRGRGFMVDQNQLDFDGGGRWLQLPDDVMAMIIGRLDILDRARMSCVCKLWKSLIRKRISVASVQLPWILLPHDWDEKQISFFNMYRGKIHTFNLPKSVLGGRCCASSQGWVLIVKGSATKPKLVLLNPISGEIVHLPSITTIPSYYDFLEESRYPYYDFSAFINKIELSSDDASTFIISANICESSVAICKPNDHKWTVFQPAEHNRVCAYTDILFSKNTLYVLCTDLTGILDPDSINSSDYINRKTVFNMESTNCTLTIKLVLDFPHLVSFGGQLAQLVQEEEDYCILENVMLKPYLVESSHGELLILHKIFDGFSDEFESDNDEGEDLSFCYFRTREFKVYKTDQSSGSRSLDDQVLFVGNNGSSISLPATELNSFRLKGNSIHFLTDMDYQDYVVLPKVCRESGNFCLDDGRIIRCYPSVECFERIGWFMPHL